LILHVKAENGVHFEHNLSWSQVKEKARLENKYIFVDCYASWCAPCKQMDRNIFSSESVMEYMDKYFVCVKVQMDTSKNDDEQIRAWYAEAHQIRVENCIRMFPSFLFFSPNGEIVHRGSGYKDVNGFIKLGEAAMDSSKQFYSLLRNYESGTKTYAMLPYLIQATEEYGNTRLSDSIKQDYLQNYLYNLSADQLYTRKNLVFIGSFLQTSREKGFDMFYRHDQKIDEIIGKKGYAKGVVEDILYNELVSPQLMPDRMYKTGEPDWKALRSTIKSRYRGPYADDLVVRAKLKWYKTQKDWPMVSQYTIIKIERLPYDTTLSGSNLLNNNIWFYIFNHCNDRKALLKSIRWQEAIVKKYPQNSTFIDTYANLLYKIGKLPQAITWQQKAALLSPGDKDIADHLMKMQRNEPTWDLSAN
jgi:thioredoxin-related protein